MIVDDTMFMRLSIRKMLEKHDFNIVGEAKNGLEAVELYKKLKPDIVTMDITMPEMSGIDALKNIISFDPKAKVVMISALGQETMVKEAIIFGAKTFIVKPFQEERIIQTLKKLLGS